MIDISNAQLDPYRGFHFFHEEVNIYLKVSLSAALLLVRYTADPNASDKLSDLIKLTHPAWNTPPVRDMTLDIQRSTYRSISAFALITIFSAFDDFLVGTDAELHRFNPKRPAKHGAAPPKDTPNDGAACDEDDDDNDDAEQQLKLYYDKNGWDDGSIAPLLTIVEYFKLCRNCIAHRNGRASRALVRHCDNKGLHQDANRLLDRTSKGLRRYSVNESVFIEPTQAIMCSHLLRRIAQDANKQLLLALGLDGFLKSVAHHTMFSEHISRSDAYKTPEAVLNFALTDRYRARITDKEECIQGDETPWFMEEIH